MKSYENFISSNKFTSYRQELLNNSLLEYLKTYKKTYVTPNHRYVFKKFDYVKVDTLIKNIKDNIYQIIDRHRFQINGENTNIYRLIDIKNTQKLGTTEDFWENEANLRKLTTEEKEYLEQYITANKYNLY